MKSGGLCREAWLVRISNGLVRSALVAGIVGGCIAAGNGLAPGAGARGENPFAPAYGHPYRHGAVPTREALEKMRAWEVSHPHSLAAPSAPLDLFTTLSFGGGVDGIGVTSGTPRVYLVFYGNQWTSGGDPVGAAAYLQNLFAGIGTGGELWSGTMTQYCDGPTVSPGATSCPSGAPLVGSPSGGALAGVWFDASGPSPSNATASQLAAEAAAAAAFFGNTTPASNRYAQYVIVSPSGTHPDGFNTPTGNFCAWHDYTTSSYGDLGFTNMPYVTDLGPSCGQNFVNGGSAGTLDGFSIVNGHEYAETLTDQNPPGGWTNWYTGQENGDECAWISSGQGAAANVSMGNGAYAMQSTWSNDTNECDISHPIVSGSSGSGGSPPPPPPPPPPGGGGD
jgi:serine protease